ncbi:MAG: hypothetical protein ACHQDE_08945, partial [Acidimicrobiia bacterium]
MSDVGTTDASRAGSAGHASLAARALLVRHGAVDPEPAGLAAGEPDASGDAPGRRMYVPLVSLARMTRRSFISRPAR